MESDVLIDLHRNFIKNQKRQIELANQLIEHANGNEEIIRLANELIKSCEKSIGIEQSINKNYGKERYLEGVNKRSSHAKFL